ncbi:MAG: hypothetical protein A7315_07470 [Candidatus Altiarchaeales archaeon WOR_SM1_79]|nr:MAG: hypothetical protein A7315_07470 [Candidatus Altiarchaeales archaeon WOR_SM1_79]
MKNKILMVGIFLIFFMGLTVSQVSESCCVVHCTPGCDDPACEACVCAMDPYCCEGEWDEICVGEVEEECATSCSCICAEIEGNEGEVVMYCADICGGNEGCVADCLKDFLELCDINCYDFCEAACEQLDGDGCYDECVEALCEEGPPVPEFGFIGIALAVLLTTPAFAYLLVRRRR